MDCSGIRVRIYDLIYPTFLENLPKAKKKLVEYYQGSLLEEDRIRLASTAMDAICHDFKTVVLEDCSVAASQEIHTQTLNIYRRNPLFPLFRVMPSSELISGLT